MEHISVTYRACLRKVQSIALFAGGRLSENLLGVFLHLDLLGTVDFGDDALLVDDECGAHGSHIGAARHFLLLPHAEGFDKHVVGVCDEGEGQLVFLDELLV